MKEIWKEIEGWEGLYGISNLGRVKSYDRIVNTKDRSGGSTTRTVPGRILKHMPTGAKEYPCVELVVDNKNRRKRTCVHRIMAIAFLPNPRGLNEINHKDGNPKNYDLSNLEWCTHQENMIHAVKTGLLLNRHAPGNKFAAKLSSAQVREIREHLTTGLTHKKIAEKYGVSKGAIGFINRRETWKTQGLI